MPDEIDTNQTQNQSIDTNVEEVKIEPIATPEVVPVLENTPPAPAEVAPMEAPAMETPQAETETAQIPVNEPLAPEEAQPKVGAETPPEAEKKPTNTPPPEPVPAPPPASVPTVNRARELWTKAVDAIQGRKRKKLEKIMKLFEKHAEITNDKVEKLLHVSDATASRYLSQLEKEGKIKQNSPTGRGVSYTKI